MVVSTTHDIPLFAKCLSLHVGQLRVVVLIDRDQKCNDTLLVNLDFLQSLVSVYIKKNCHSYQ